MTRDGFASIAKGPTRSRVVVYIRYSCAATDFLCLGYRRVLDGLGQD